MASSNPPASDDHSPQKKTSSAGNKPSQVIVYDPLNHHLFFDSDENLNKTYPSFPVHLPRWRNRVNIYLDEEHKTGFVTSIDLSQIGFGKNLKRRLEYDYTVLHIKGIKPAMPESARLAPLQRRRALKGPQRRRPRLRSPGDDRILPAPIHDEIPFHRSIPTLKVPDILGESPSMLLFFGVASLPCSWISALDGILIEAIVVF